MRTVPSAITTALAAAPTEGLVARELVTIFALDPDTNAEVEFPFWNDIGTVTMNVVDGDDGTTVSRDFVGDGALLAVGDIPNVNDLSIRRVPVTLSALHETVQDMFRGNNIRLVRAEVHRALLNPETHNLADTPICHFIGQVNMAPEDRPGPGGEAGIGIDIVSDTVELTRTNPAKRSDEFQKLRSGDRAMKYVSLVQSIELSWGEGAANQSGTATPGGSSRGSR